MQYRELTFILKTEKDKFLLREKLDICLCDTQVIIMVVYSILFVLYATKAS